MDDELFEEFDALARDAEKALQSAKDRLAKTMLEWEKENALKELRDLETLKQEALAEFDSRKEAREIEMADSKGAFDDAVAALDANTKAI